ncbi:MAG: O-antigen ligase family protein, partial [Oscillospiraceae bacterium]
MTETKICGAKEKTRLIAWMASIYFVCMPLSIIPLPGDISLLKAISILIGGGFIIALFIGENKIKLNVVHFFLFLYVVYSLSSIFILHDENAWTNLRGILETTVIFTLISTRIYNKREKNLILNSWIIVGAISVIFMLTSGVNITGGGERLTLSLAGGNEDPNQFCGYFFLPILISLDRIVKPGTKIRYRIFYIIFILSMIYVVFATGSRGGLIAVVAAIVGFLFFAVRGVGGKIKILTVTILLGAIFATVLFPLLPESIVERMSVESVLEDGGSGRFEIWGVIWEAIFRSEKSVIVGN